MLWLITYKLHQINVIYMFHLRGITTPSTLETICNTYQKQHVPHVPIIVINIVHLDTFHNFFLFFKMYLNKKSCFCLFFSCVYIVSCNYSHRQYQTVKPFFSFLSFKMCVVVHFLKGKRSACLCLLIFFQFVPSCAVFHAQTRLYGRPRHVYAYDNKQKCSQ